MNTELAPDILDRLEFHRNALALMPTPEDSDPGVAVCLLTAGSVRDGRSCNCRAWNSKTCPHLIELSRIAKSLIGPDGNHVLDTVMRAGPWFRFATALHDISKSSFERRPGHAESDALPCTAPVFDGKAGEHLTLHGLSPVDNSGNEPADPFFQRCASAPAKNGNYHRGRILTRLTRLTYTPTENALLEMGRKTRLMALEESFWFKLAYHGFRQVGNPAVRFSANIDASDGTFTLVCRNHHPDPLFTVGLNRQQVATWRLKLAGLVDNPDDLAVLDTPLKSVCKLSLAPDRKLCMTLFLTLEQPGRDPLFFERKAMQPFAYGDLIYLTPLKRFTRIEMPDTLWKKFDGRCTLTAPREKIPRLMEKYGSDLDRSPYLIDDALKGLNIYKTADRLEIMPINTNGSWHQLSISYGFGDSRLSLKKILTARKAGRRYIPLPGGWIDSQTLDLDAVTGIPGLPVVDQLHQGADHFKFSGLDLFRLQASFPNAVTLDGPAPATDKVSTLLALRPSAPLPRLPGLQSTLREYQKLGTRWLTFLYENGFSGLLCDDMGLGKTHQCMAFMVWLKQIRRTTHPFLVVCPTTVLYHWETKVAEHAPGLRVSLFYGSERNLARALKNTDLLLTSYGLLRREIASLERIPFTLAIFDEAQHLKNKTTQTYRAAQGLNARMKLAVTGTPIENSLIDLKALMDLSIPGYLGSDDRFQFRYIRSMEGSRRGQRREELSRLVSPFTLRRLKSNVLSELPPKIEDIRTCRLSEDQVGLYREAVETKGQSLVDALARVEQPVPYIHIFSLLTRLKQICDHPALLNPTDPAWQACRSGKWDLFTELLAESLDSGQKIVVYSQFLGMLDMIETHLRQSGVGVVKLTGASRNRGQLIDRFNTDPACRVFAGSLKAGGAGIDLVAASVVIHYDRWWNAAREDQATDRVHRIGQNRGVQVFKLVTRGTLEEKISRIIEKKRRLLEGIIKEDDPGLLKSFSRDDLIEMLSFPSSDKQDDPTRVSC